MRFKTIVTAVALVAACYVANCGALSVGQEAAQDAPKAEAKAFDFSVFDVPEGKDAAFYTDAFDKIVKYLNEDAPKNDVDSEKILKGLSGAMKTIYKGLVDATDNDGKAKCMHAFQIYLSTTMQTANDPDALKAIYAEEKAAGKSQERTSYAYFVMVMSQLRGDLSDAELKAIAADLTANVNEFDPMMVAQLAQTLMRANPKLLKDDVAKIVELYSGSDDERKKMIAKSLEGGLRFASLLGNEMKVEGLYLDKTEIDWKSYRGKVVLVDFWATWCGPCVAEVPNVLALYEKYHDAGFEVLGYSIDDDLEALEKFEKERKLPWKTASSKLSVEAKENGGKEYVDLSEYYGVNAIPTMILVGKDGKVISLEARGEELKKLLKEQFPDVK